MKHLRLVICALTLCLLLGAAVANAADGPSLKDLKAAGAQALSAEQVKALVLKGTIRGVSKQWKDTIKFFDDGTLKVDSCQIASGKCNQARGTWSVDADGTFRMTQNWSKGKEEYAGKAYAKGSEHYFFSPDAGDDADWVYMFR